MLIRQGAWDNPVLVVRDGALKASVETPAGRSGLITFKLPGDLVGASEAIDGAPSSSSVSALNSVDAVVFSAEVFMRLIRTRPTISDAVLRALVADLRAADLALVRNSTMPVFHRVIVSIADLVDTRLATPSDHEAVTIEVFQRDLAAACGCTRETLAKALAVLRDNGFIETSRNGLTIRSVLGLHELARRIEADGPDVSLDLWRQRAQAGRP